MGRRPVTEQRRNEVLDAFVRCVARYGLDGATLERLATESGLKRPLIRHHLGNKEEMVAALVDHIIAKFDEQLSQIQGALAGQERLSTLIELLFSEGAGTQSDLILSFAALTARADQDEAMRKALLGSLSNFEQFLSVEVAAAYPEAGERKIAAVAQSLMALSFNLDSLSPLQPPQRWRLASRDAAMILIASLDSHTGANQ